jgi:hypothetical protein
MGEKAAKKASTIFFVNLICGNVLANRATVLLAQEVTNIARAVFILHNHFVAAFSAIDNTMDKSGSRPWNASGLVAIILSIIVFEHILNFFVGFPRDIARVFIVHTDSPLIHG